MKIEPTNNTDLLTNYVLKLFHNKYTSGAIRSVAVNYSGFVDESFGGSLKNFIASFTQETKLSEADVNELIDILHSNMSEEK